LAKSRYLPRGDIFANRPKKGGKGGGAAQVDEKNGFLCTTFHPTFFGTWAKASITGRYINEPNPNP